LGLSIKDERYGRSDISPRRELADGAVVADSVGETPCVFLAGPGLVQSGPLAAADDGTKSSYALAKEIDSETGWQIFLRQHPEGFFADLARARLAEIANEQADKNEAPDVRNTAVATRDLQQKRHDPSLPPDTYFWWWPRWR
jgi:hypothetical protein